MNRVTHPAPTLRSIAIPTIRSCCVMWLVRLIKATAPVFLVLLGAVSCASLPGNGALTLKETRLNVNWKMTAYQQAQIGGSVTEAQAQQVNAAFHAYQLAFKKALATADGNVDAPTPPSLQSIVNQLIEAVDNVLSTLI